MEVEVPIESLLSGSVLRSRHMLHRGGRCLGWSCGNSGMEVVRCTWNREVGRVKGVAPTQVVGRVPEEQEEGVSMDLAQTAID